MEFKDIMAQVQRLEMERMKKELPPAEKEPSAIHYAELPEDKGDDAPARDWNLYRREVARLLAEGHEGKWVLINGAKIIGIWNTRQEAEQVRLRDFLMQDVLLQEIRTWEPLLRGPTILQIGARG
jgi:hypothetical protein